STGQTILQAPLKPKAPPKRPVEDQLKEIREAYEADLKGPTALPPRGSLRDIIGQVDSNEKLDLDVEEILMEMADEFIDSITAFGCKLAKHRGSNVLEVKDLHYHLERNWNLRIPGFNTSELRMVKKGPTSSHQLRITNVKRAQKEQANLSKIKLKDIQVAAAAAAAASAVGPSATSTATVPTVEQLQDGSVETVEVVEAEGAVPSGVIVPAIEGESTPPSAFVPNAEEFVSVEVDPALELDAVEPAPRVAMEVDA
ncbi:hypothetical protein HDU67_002424, partial [Dinochytrium kinnereticum]